MYLRSVVPTVVPTVVPYNLKVRFTLPQKQTLRSSQRPHCLEQNIISNTYNVLLSPSVIILLSAYIKMRLIIF